LQGVINRFDYLNNGDLNSDDSLGIQGIWLSPIFSSPSYHKYDATNYYSVDWRFGTEEDLKELIKICEERNVKLILDLVLNHTSSSHEWFLKFKEARINGDTENKYYNYYSCVPTAEKAGGVTYQKIAGIDCWYECNFSGDMPELNYDNEEVKQEMLNVAKYYLDLGIDGFRFDAIKYIYYGNTDKSVDFWEWYMGELKKIKPDIYCVGECWSGETEVLDYYSAMNCFNFAMSQAEGVAATAAGNDVF
jgi:glycosidase